MAQANFNLGVFQETKFTNEIHKRMLVGYRVFTANMPSWHRGRVAVFYRDSPHIQFKELQQHRLNVLRFQVAL